MFSQENQRYDATKAPGNQIARPRSTVKIQKANGNMMPTESALFTFDLFQKECSKGVHRTFRIIFNLFVVCSRKLSGLRFGSFIFASMNLDWLKTGIGPLKDLLTFLNKESKTSDVLKRQVIRELRDNLNVFHNAYKNNNSPDVMIDLLSNEAIKDAIKNNFRFKKIKAGTIEPYHVYDDRNKKYVGWDAEELIDKIDEKIEELKIIKKLNGNSVEKVKNNISLMMSNLYYRMKLLADFIKGPK